VTNCGIHVRENTRSLKRYKTTGAVNTIIIIIFNCMVVRGFRQKGLLSSSTVPLIILAICDMLASLFMFWPNEIGFVFDFFYFDDRKETDIFLQRSTCLTMISVWFCNQ
jgi:hypothetical protein